MDDFRKQGATKRRFAKKRKGFCKKKRVVDEGIADEQSSNIHFNVLEQVAGPSSTTAEEQTQTDLHSSAASRKLKVNINDRYL